MSSTHASHLDLIRRTRRYRPEVLDAAQKLAGVSIEELADMARQFIANGEDSALGVLMNVCAIRELRIPPELLPSILEVIEPIIDFGPLMAFQDEAALPHLLDAAGSEAVSFQRQAYAGILAAEMSLLHGVNAAPVLHLLRILEQSYSSEPGGMALLASAFSLLEIPEEERQSAGNFLCQARIIDLLPDMPPPVVIGDGGTVRPSISACSTAPAINMPSSGTG
jgi:hypothetical protein